MSLSSHLKDLFRGIRAQFMGHEANLIPLSGLSLEIEHLSMAKQALRESQEDYSDLDDIQALETAWAEYTSAGHAFSFSSGRTALSAILEALDLQSGEGVLVCGYTCIAVSNSVVFLGGEPIYYDIELNTYGPSLSDIQSKFEASATPIKGIIVQHTFGMIGDETVATVEWARSEGLWVVEDACHALGAYRGKIHCGSLGEATFYSTERSKCISTFQGGVATCNSQQLSERLDKIHKSHEFPPFTRTQHILRQFIHFYNTQRDNGRWFRRLFSTMRHRAQYIPGNTPEELRQEKPPHYAYRMPSPLAKLALSQLKRNDHWNDVRRAKAQEWAFWADHRGLQRPHIKDEDGSVYLRYPVLVEPDHKRNRDWAEGLGIEMGVWYTSCLHPTAIPVANCPNAELAAKQCVNLPTNLAYKA